MAIKQVTVSDLGRDMEVKVDISDSASLGQGSRGECWVDAKGDRVASARGPAQIEGTARMRALMVRRLTSPSEGHISGALREHRPSPPPEPEICLKNFAISPDLQADKEDDLS